ncbi:hypothetical protein FHE66_08565 [Georgenia sp. 311]|uniref:hypothetical protein n=1 Tax=Georgenia sp. 311 TaxID=2585134 RepID=UPI0011118864|nr:hypothetical protein [Georgenia sp. 311]TNC18038.1 hypothetical protein FHE66_08565 [Georgenia sp. 311]
MVIDAPSHRSGRPRAVAGVGVLALRSVGVVLLVASAVLGAQAAWSRFGVCFGGDAPPVAGLPGGDPQGSCVLMQDHAYDFIAPDHPWVPIAGATAREGMSLVLLGLGVALVALSLTGRRHVRLLSVLAGAGFAAAWIGMGVPELRSGLAGEPVAVDAWNLASVGADLALLATAALAVLAGVRGGPDRRPVVVFWAAATLAHPVPEYFFTVILWNSHDASPLTGFFRSALVAAAAVAAAVTMVPPGRGRLPRRRGS